MTETHKSPVKKLNKADIQPCCGCVLHALRNVVVRACLLCAILVFCFGGVALLVCGAVYGSVAGFFISGSLSLLIAVLLLVIYFWFSRRSSPIKRSHKNGTINGQIATIASPEYYQQVPPGMKSDFPMGPLLIMTLPRTNSDSKRGSSLEGDKTAGSTTSTPDIERRNLRHVRKNLPPLASVETLSPSLRSSCPSINSVV